MLQKDHLPKINSRARKFNIAIVFFFQKKISQKLVLDHRPLGPTTSRTNDLSD